MGETVGVTANLPNNLPNVFCTRKMSSAAESVKSEQEMETISTILVPK